MNCFLIKYLFCFFLFLGLLLSIFDRFLPSIVQIQPFKSLLNRFFSVEIPLILFTIFTIFTYKENIKLEIIFTYIFINCWISLMKSQIINRILFLINKFIFYMIWLLNFVKIERLQPFLIRPLPKFNRSILIIPTRFFWIPPEFLLLTFSQ